MEEQRVAATLKLCVCWLMLPEVGTKRLIWPPAGESFSRRRQDRRELRGWPPHTITFPPTCSNESLNQNPTSFQRNWRQNGVHPSCRVLIPRLREGGQLTGELSVPQFHLSQNVTFGEFCASTKNWVFTEVSLPVQEPRMSSADGTQLPRVASAPATRLFSSDVVTRIWSDGSQQELFLRWCSMCMAHTASQQVRNTHKVDCRRTSNPKKPDVSLHSPSLHTTSPTPSTDWPGGHSNLMTQYQSCQNWRIGKAGVTTSGHSSLI